MPGVRFPEIEDHQAVLRVRLVGPTSGPNAWREALGFVGRFLFFQWAPIFFVITCVMINQPFLLVLLLLMLTLTGLLSRPAQILARCPWLARVALVGDGLKMLGNIHDYYHDNPPRSFVYYLFYPVTAPVAALVTPAARREARLYAGILGTIFFAILVESVLTYRSVFPPFLSIADALVWVIVRLFFSFLLVLGLLVPVAATTFSYRHAGKKWRLRVLTAVGLLSAVVSVTYHYVTTGTNISFLSSEHLALRLTRPAFRDALRESTEVFLGHYVQRLPAAGATPATQEELTAKYRLAIGKLAIDDEARAFSVFVLPVQGQTWLGVRLVYNENTNRPPLLLALVDPHGRCITAWRRLPADIQARFQIEPYARSDAALLYVGAAALLDDLQ